MVKRVVMDTNYFRTLKGDDFAPVRALGFTVSVNMSAFYETSAAAAREKKPGMIIGPARALSGVVDPTYPIAPNAGDFLWRYSRSRRRSEVDKVRPPYRAWAAYNWALAATGNVDEAALKSIGLEADTYLRQRGKS